MRGFESELCECGCLATIMQAGDALRYLPLGYNKHAIC